MPRHKATTSTKKKKSPKKEKIPLDANDLVEAAQAALHAHDPQQAVQLYDAALVQNGANPQGALEILEKRAEAKVSLGDQDGACSDYERALGSLNALQHGRDPTASEYNLRGSLELYIGQLSEGADALQRYRNGVQALQSCLELHEDTLAKGADDVMQAENTIDPKTAVAEARRNLAAAWCSAAELYLTDLCFEENAEQECESMVKNALGLVDGLDGEPGVDALQTATSLLLSQSRPQEAMGYALRTFSKMKTGCQALAILVGLRDPDVDTPQATELLELESVQMLPGFEFRCQTAKLLLECAATTTGSDDDISGDKTKEKGQDCVAAAIDVLGSLLSENDEVVEIWYLTGDALAATEPPSAEAAIHHWHRAVEMLSTVKTSLEEEAFEAEGEEEDELQEQLEDLTCQIEEITSKIGDMDSKPPGEDTVMQE